MERGAWQATVHVVPRARYNLATKPGFLGGSAGEESTCNAGYLGSIPGFRRYPGEGKGYPLQYSGLEISMVAKSWKRLSYFHFICVYILKFSG